MRQAARLRFSVGVVSNGYWATSLKDALEWLRPFAGLIDDLSISSDLYHSGESLSIQAKTARQAADQLHIPVGIISIAQPEDTNAAAAIGQLPAGESGVMYRGRAAVRLAQRARLHPWDQFAECPYENLREPGRVHVDPSGNLHICQGISLGNLFETPLREICDSYDPDAHPITDPLLDGGPAELVRRYELPHQAKYADACHLCDHARRQLRMRLPDILTPDSIYGEFEAT